MGDVYITRKGGGSTEISPGDYIVATGGDIYEYNVGGARYRSHTFISSGTFQITQLSTISSRNLLDYLIIAGGGGGSNFGSGGGYAGGGGAGGYRTTLGTSGRNSAARPKVTATLQSYSIVIGAGGNPGQNGGNSSALGVSCTGGGTGGGLQGFTALLNGNPGGSGGGGGGQTNGTTRTGGAGTTDEGFEGGNGSPNTGTGGGGGGAGGAGLSATNLTNERGGNGGHGLLNELRLGILEYRAAGGGGSATPGGGYGGLGGGGAGGNNTSGGRLAPAPHTGSGGSGSGSGGTAGASGIVVIRYEIAPLEL
jgi:hypothetical protein